MEELQSFLELITPGCFMTSLDLKDAYYYISINQGHKKYLKFYWKVQLYKLLVSSNGLCSGPGKFAKLMKPPRTTLRTNGYIVAIYIDDFINVRITFQEFVDNIMASIELLDSLGFIIQPDKSSFMSKKNITFLGFNINSINMKISLTN